MRMPNIEKWIPNLILILLFENGRKQGLGLWLVVMAFGLFVKGVNGFGLHDLDTYVWLGSFIFAGGNVADKLIALKAGKTTDAVPA